MRPVALAGILASTTILGGCAGTIAGVSLSSISSFAGFASTLFTGADLGEHAVSIVTGKDCRFSEGLMREDRDVCEEPGSPATRDDFHGIFVERIDADGTVIFAAPKYMPANVGGGEASVDQIWAEIKTQKAKDETERQLARANAAQSIDVAALATGSLSSESLAVLPPNTKAVAEIADASDTASQTATGSRPVVNAAKPAPKKAAESTAAVDLPLDQPAIDEVALTAPLKAAKENGQGGPLFTTAASGVSAPVASKIVNGEPVVILRLAPMFGGVAPSSDTASAEPSAIAQAEPAPTVMALKTTPISAPSPQALLTETVASIEPQMPSARPRTKPAPAAAVDLSEGAVVEPVAVEKPKPVRKKKVEPVAEPADVFQPPSRETESLAASATPDLIASSTSDSEAPSDAAAATAPVAAYVPPAAPSEPAPAATSGPAPLFPIAQP